MQTIKFYKENSNIVINSGCIILCGLFFYLDWITQLGYAAGAPYAIVVMLATVLNAKNKVLIYAGLSTLLIIIGFYLSSVSDVYSNAIINRIVSVLILWVIAFFCVGHVNSKKILEDSWRNLNLIFNAAPGALVMINPQGVIELVDDSLCELFGYDRDALIGQHIEILVPEKFRQQHLQYREDYNKSPEQKMMAARSELYARTKDGRILPVEIGLNPIKFGQDSKVIASIVDISENKRQLEILTNYAAKLKKSNQYLEEFAYVASHDLQEPLRMVSSYTQLLANRYQDKLDQDANEFINYAVDGAKRMQVLIQDLLMFSRLSTQSIKKDPVDANDLYQAALDNLTTAIKESGTVVSKDDLPVVSGDVGLLRQLFQNLIGNAVKYCEPTRNNQVHVSAQQLNDEWQFCIKDNGIGIKPEYFEKIFVIFQRLHARSQYQGTGIGLALCLRIVDTHGGKLWVESVYGQGSCFYFTLPGTD